MRAIKEYVDPSFGRSIDKALQRVEELDGRIQTLQRRLAALQLKREEADSRANALLEEISSGCEVDTAVVSNNGRELILLTEDKNGNSS